MTDPPAAQATTLPPEAPSAASSWGKRARAVQFLGGAAVVLVTSIGVAWAARRYVLSSPRFAVRSLRVEGAHHKTIESVNELAGVAIGKNIFALDTDVARNALEADPWIELAKVSRVRPSTVRIEITEREPRGLVIAGCDRYLVTREGEIFKKNEEDDDAVDLPLITGLQRSDLVQDRRALTRRLRDTLDVQDDLERAGITKRHSLQELHLEKDGTAIAFVGRTATALFLGPPPYKDKVDRAAKVLAEASHRGTEPSVLFLDNDSHPERVVVRFR